MNTGSRRQYRGIRYRKRDAWVRRLYIYNETHFMKIMEMKRVFGYTLAW